jgi:hypothetical protein
MSANIANIIWKQITAGGKIIVMSWGVPLNSRVGHDEEDGSGWLRFKVSGMKFKGIVKVTYLPVPDVYKIEFHKKFMKDIEYGVKEVNYKVIHTIEMVFCDELTEKIDDYVEKIPAYKR